MAIVVSHHTGPLGLPGGPVLNPGKRTLVDRWDVIKGHIVVQAWLTAGVISVEDDGDQAPVQTVEGQGVAYDVIEKGRGWYVVSLDGQDLTKSLRRDDVEGFDGLSAEDQAAFVAAHRPD